MASEGRNVVLRLYREILKLHKAKLPPPMKTLGDKYVQTEFKVPAQVSVPRLCDRRAPIWGPTAQGWT